MKRLIFVFLALCVLAGLAVPAFAEDANSDWESAYAAILNEKWAEIMAGEESDPDYLGECTYTLYDIDKDEVPELILKMGTCEADYHGEIYTFRDGGALRVCDELGLGHSSLYTCPDENGIILMYGHMGYAEADRLTLEGNTVRSEMMYEDNLNERLEKDPEADYVYPGDVVPGSVYLTLFRADRQLPLRRYEEVQNCLAGKFPEAASDGDAADIDAEFFEKLVASNDEVVAVAADNYTKSPGPIGFQDLLKKDVAKDWMSGDCSVLSAQPADLNADGQPEYVMTLTTDGEHSELCCCLSEQNGVVYAYLFDWYASSLEVDSAGNLWYGGEYYETLYRLIFDGEEAFELSLPAEYRAA